jgi:hypothetical protein
MSVYDRSDYVIEAFLVCKRWLNDNNVQGDIVEYYLNNIRGNVRVLSEQITGVRPVLLYEILAAQAASRVGRVMFNNIYYSLIDSGASSMNQIELWLACTSFCLMVESVRPDQEQAIEKLLMELGRHLREDRGIGEAETHAWLTATFAQCGLSIDG